MYRIGLVAGVLTSFFLHSAVHAALLENYEFQGQPGSQTSVRPSFTAANVIGVNFGELNLTPTAGVNSINASGWITPGRPTRSASTWPRATSPPLINWS